MQVSQWCPEEQIEPGFRVVIRCVHTRAAACRRPAVASSKAVMLMNGFTTDQLAGLVRIGFIAKATERVASSGQTSEVKRFKLTEAGQQALGRSPMTPAQGGKPNSPC